MNLRDMYDILVACNIHIRHNHIYEPRLQNEVEEDTRSTLAQLRRYITQYPRYQYLNKGLNQAAKSLDLMYILGELEKILNELGE